MGNTPSIGPTRHWYGVTFPIILIVIGVMFLLSEFVPRLEFERTWPVLLIVFGVLRLLDINRPPRPPEGPRI